MISPMSVVLLSLLGACAAAPVEEVVLPPRGQEVSAPAAGPAGVWQGTMGITPYQKGASGLTCTTCQAVYAKTFATFYPNFMYLNISAAQNSNCQLYAQSYLVNYVVPGIYPFTYTGHITAEGSTFPVCYFFNNQRFAIILDGTGTCPSQTALPYCQNGWTPGTISQAWVGNFMQTQLPSGLFQGTAQIVPYTNNRGSYSCTTCGIITTGSYAHWSADILTIGLNGARVGACSLNAQAVPIIGVQAYSATDVGYFRGNMVIEGAASPVCFYFYNGHFSLLADGTGNCPHPASPASCSPTQKGRVSQIWVGDYR